MDKRVLWLATIAMTGILQASTLPQEANATWGGEHIELVITDSGAQIEFDCATGTISEPVPLDSTTTFKLKGTFSREHGGPIRKDETPNTAKVTYSGRVENGKMILTVLVDGKDPYEGAFVLERGRAGRVTKCR
jgi:hypothetical protein